MVTAVIEIERQRLLGHMPQLNAHNAFNIHSRIYTSTEAAKTSFPVERCALSPKHGTKHQCAPSGAEQVHTVPPDRRPECVEDFLKAGT